MPGSPSGNATFGTFIPVAPSDRHEPLHEHLHEPLDFIAAFEDPEAAAKYAEGPRRLVPGFDALHRMTGILLAESTPPDARRPCPGARRRRGIGAAGPGRGPSGLDLRRRQSGEGNAAAGGADARSPDGQGDLDPRVHRRCAGGALRRRDLPLDPALPPRRRTGSRTNRGRASTRPPRRHP